MSYQTKLFLVEVKPKSKETSKVVLPTAVCKTKMHKIEKNIEMLKKSWRGLTKIKCTIVVCFSSFCMPQGQPIVRRGVQSPTCEKTQSHLKSQFPPEMTLPKSQQNFQTCLKSNFLFTPISNIYFKKFSRWLESS